MKKEFVPYDIALAMKELGFDETCFGFYNDMDNNTPMGANYPCDGLNSAPLYQQAFRWFREKHKLHYSIRNIGYGRWKFGKWSKSYDTYEEAELACLKKLIEIINQNKDE